MLMLIQKLPPLHQYLVHLERSPAPPGRPSEAVDRLLAHHDQNERDEDRHPAREWVRLSVAVAHAAAPCEQEIGATRIADGHSQKV